ncbi:carboxymuconolactone decarboxylase [Sphingobacterium sp. DK4209]|uniref:Carboxymuconolactone decarboxylase n=1 Tax=Sphingobacterium zhuxiongii TaxID=2662364 RepID=A0A5Q0Q880_9SPHI|nr:MULTISPECIES: carboxymuconolactone decarboxylase family protein [unclassified Sphingobacterium]MVZ64246.1 carboxymuconolactone decarboxylase [Sphingobacterium sp. DK4209]QGA25596.1 carboxymuconolactone decarboxylase [Sphingobacterium sp. dk4302]
MKQLVFLGLVIISVFTNTHLMAQNKAVSKLSASDQSLISISALTGKGDLEKLKVALNRGLEHGLTVNEIKEVLIHTYAYCGFPRSIRGLQTFMEVLSERQEKGIKDEMGKQASNVDIESNKYDRGKKILGELTQTVQADTLSGYSAFAPTIDRFLKEHLFADIFERDVLTYAQRELVTVSVLAAIGQAEPMLNSHLTICLNVGLSPEQLQQYVDVLRLTIGETDAEAAQKVLDKVIEKRK